MALDLLITYIPAPTKDICQKPATTLRCLKSRGGTMAVFGRKTWIATKAIRRIDIMVRRAMTRPLFHWISLMHDWCPLRVSLTAYCCPPHCNASTKHMTPGIRHNAPSGSSWSSFSFVESVTVFELGTLIVKARTIRTSPPMGKLM